MIDLGDFVLPVCAIVLALSVVFTVGKDVGYHKGLKKNRDIHKESVELFAETCRHKYAVLTMMVMSEKSRGLAPLPTSKESFENIWREIEYRYRHWAVDEKTETWGEPPSVPPSTGAN